MPNVQPAYIRTSSANAKTTASLLAGSDESTMISIFSALISKIMMNSQTTFNETIRLEVQSILQTQNHSVVGRSLTELYRQERYHALTYTVR